MQKLSIAILDDDDEVRASLQRVLTRRGYPVFGFAAPRDFLRAVGQRQPDILLLDLNLGDGVESGLDVLTRLREERPGIHVVVISGTADIRKAVEAIKLGAREFIEKPVGLDPILACIAQIEARVSLDNERATLLDQILSGHELIGVSRGITETRERILQYAELNEPVLITGESGTGKELVAANAPLPLAREGRRGSHQDQRCLDPRRVDRGPALRSRQGGLLRRGCRQRDGIMKSAGGSTLFVDEIGELKPALQPKLLRAIEEREVLPIGSNDPIAVEVRFVFATNQRLLARMEEGKFRSDLYYRISTLTIEIPPLRERREDIAPLAQRFARDFCVENNLRFKELSPAALARLQEYDFPGTCGS